MSGWFGLLATVVIAVFTGLTWRVYKQIWELMNRSDLDRYMPMVYLKWRGTTGAGPGQSSSGLQLINHGSGPARHVRARFFHPTFEAPREQLTGDVMLLPKDWDGAGRSMVPAIPLTYPTEQGPRTEGFALVVTYEDLFGRRFESRGDRGGFSFRRL